MIVKQEYSLLDPKLREFRSSSHEQIILAKRKHWLSIFPQILIVVFSTGLVIFLLISFGYFLFRGFLYLLPPVIFLISIFALSGITKIVIDWYFHLYILTNRRISEVFYTALFSYRVNDVLLDQVKCTEINVRSQGLINELFHIGDIVITVDRPIHEQEVVLSSIKNPRQTGIFLSRVLNTPTTGNPTVPLWYRSRTKPGLMQFTEDIAFGNFVEV